MNVPSPQPHLAQEILQRLRIGPGGAKPLDKLAEFVQTGARQGEIRAHLRAVEGGIDMLVLPLLWVDSLLHQTLVIRLRGRGPLNARGEPQARHQDKNGRATYTSRSRRATASST